MGRTARSFRESALCRDLGLRFADPGLLRQAVTHSSFANESRGAETVYNERLEFLGDSVLSLVVSEYLYRNYGELSEGELSKARAMIVCEQSLAVRAKALNLGSHLLLGRGEDATGGRERASILADAFEAVIGAIYLDQGFAAAGDFILRQFGSDLDQSASDRLGRDYKTILQEVIQRSGDSKIAYEIVEESGPDHNKLFTTQVKVSDVLMGTGTGRTKKEAEQRAAAEALGKIQKQSD